MNKEEIKKAILENPGATIILDIDYWDIYRCNPGVESSYPPGYETWPPKEQIEFYDGLKIIGCKEQPDGKLLSALLEMAKLKVEWV